MNEFYPNDNICWDCKYFYPNDNKTDVGECRRYPPVLCYTNKPDRFDHHTIADISYFPCVPTCMTCGEFTKIDETISQSENIKTTANRYDFMLNNRESKILELFYSENLSANQVAEKFNIDLDFGRITANRAYQIRDVAARKIAKAIFSKKIE